jgi:hypothetical protein
MVDYQLDLDVAHEGRWWPDEIGSHDNPLRGAHRLLPAPRGAFRDAVRIQPPVLDLPPRLTEGTAAACLERRQRVPILM